MSSRTYVAELDRVLAPLGFARDHAAKPRDAWWRRIRNEREEMISLNTSINLGTTAQLFSRDLALERLVREAMPSPSPVHFACGGVTIGCLIDGRSHYWRHDKNGPRELAEAVASRAPAYFDGVPAREASYMESEKASTKEWWRAPDVVELALRLHRAGQNDEACKMINRKLSKFTLPEWARDVEAVRRWLGCTPPSPEAPKA